MTEPAPAPTGTRRYEPSEEEVQDLIRRAEEHELGPEFLLGGALDAVAATFGAHAFTVEAARETLRGAPSTIEVRPLASPVSTTSA